MGDPPLINSASETTKTSMIEESPGNAGKVRIRSNVCLEADAWDLVPGDVLRRYNLHFGRLTAKQHEELMYYEPCSVCRRVLYEIMEYGCDYSICRQQGKVPSTAEAEQRKSRRRDVH